MSDKQPAKKRSLSDTSDVAPSPKRSNNNNSPPSAPISSRKRPFYESSDDETGRQTKRYHYDSDDVQANLFIPPSPILGSLEEDESDGTSTTLSAPPDETTFVVPKPPEPVPFECPVCYTDGASSGHAMPTCGHKICLGCYTNIAVRNPDTPLCPCCRKPYMAVEEILEEEPRHNDILYLSQADALMLSFILGIGPQPAPLVPRPPNSSL